LKLQVQKYLGRLSLIGCKGKEKERLIILSLY
jgi:hypothetical protein